MNIQSFNKIDYTIANVWVVCLKGRVGSKVMPPANKKTSIYKMFPESLPLTPYITPSIKVVY